MNRKKSANKKNTIIDYTVAAMMVIGVLFLLVSLLTQKVSPPQPAIIHRIPVSIPDKGFLLGISLYDSNLTPFIEIQKKSRTNFQILGIYQAWGSANNNFPKDFAERASQLSVIPLITCEPWKPVGGFDRSENLVQQDEYKLSEINNGKYDTYITNYAREVATYGKPLFIRLAHEMNGNWYSWGSKFNTPEEYIAMWQHVRNIFKKENATNASFVWSPNVIYDEPSIPYTSDIEKFYPGDSYVDWVGMSGFNWAGTYKNNVWIEPEDLYTPTLTKLESFQKPIMISETASAESTDGNSKANWIKNLKTYLEKHPTIKALVWFNVEDNGINWKIDSSPSSLSSFSSVFQK